MSSIYLIRHGQASFGQENYDQLSPLGEQQAARLGQALSQRLPMFDAVVMGSLLRHKQTAERCLTEFDQRVDRPNFIIDAGWNEYDHQNVLAQFSAQFSTAASTTEFLASQVDAKTTFEKMFSDAMTQWMTNGANPNDNHSSSGYTETWADFTTRVQLALQNILTNPLAADSHAKIAVFTSGGPISLVAQSLLGVPQTNIMDMNWTLMNCGVTKLVKTRSRTFVASLNEHTHFEGDGNKHFITYS